LHLIKIFYLVSTLRRTGPTNQLLNILKYLDRNKFLPYLLTLSPEPEDSMLEYFKNLNIPIDSLGLSRVKGLIASANLLKKTLKKYQPDLIHSNGIRADVLSSNYFKGIKRIATLRCCPYHNYPVVYGKIIGSYMAFKHIQALRKIDYPVGCSYAMAEEMKKKYGLDLVVVQNGVDKESFGCPINNEKIEIRKKLNLNLDKRIFVFVGNLNSGKNPSMLIKTFLASKISQKCLLIIIGDGPLRNICEKIANNNPNIKFVGRVDHVGQLLKASDFFISLSASEGLPNAALEAMATGLPVYLSDIIPHREILNYNKNAGKLLPLGDERQIIKILESSMADDYSVMSVAAASTIDQYLNAEKMSEQYQQLYQRAVKEN